MTHVTITLPLPHRVLSPNGRAHWRQKASEIRAYRRRSQVAAWTATFGYRDQFPWHAAEIEIAWFAKTARKVDQDNVIASMKSAIDGLVDGGILSDDRDVTYRPVRREKDASNPRVEITVWRADEDE